jgi:hypothetical protein
MSEVMSEEVKPVDQPRSWFGYDSVLVPLVTCAYYGAMLQIVPLIPHTLEAKISLSIALVAPLVLPLGLVCEELAALWKKRKA